MAENLTDAKGGLILGKIKEKGVLGGVTIRDGKWVCILWENGIARAFGGESLYEAAEKAAEAAGVTV